MFLPPFIPRIFDTLGIRRTTLLRYDAPGDADGPDPWTQRADHILSRLKALHPGMETWLARNPRTQRLVARPAPLPKADLVLDVSGMLFADLGHKPSFLLPVPPRSALSADAIARRGYRPMEDLLIMPDPEVSPRPATVVFDFRAAPEEIAGALRRFRRPPPARQGSPPPPPGEGAQTQG